jgi:serine protease Do
LIPRRLICVVSLIAAGLCMLDAARAADLPDTVARIKGGVVGVGTVERTRRPPALFRGTGFAVGDGRYVVTNWHVISEPMDDSKKEFLAVFIGEGPEIRPATIAASDPRHDVAVLKISGDPLPSTLTLGDSDKVREGELYAFTGFPIGVVLGLHPVTHRGLISSITPIAIPMPASGELNDTVIDRLRNPFDVFQLDATAYPGNSGSPLYDPATGTVVGIVNMVFVKESKETVLQKPSGIAYAIPINFAQHLLDEKHISR